MLTAVWGVARLVPNAVVLIAVGAAGLVAVGVLVLNQAMVSGSLGYLVMVLAASLFSVFTVMAAFSVTRDVDLRDKGTRHSVTVVGERAVRQPGQKMPEWHYTLYEGGVALPGELVTITHEFRPGQVIVVYSRGTEHKPAAALEREDLAAGTNAGYAICLPLWLVVGYFAPTRRGRGRGAEAQGPAAGR